jgi:aminoglycoside 3-N-acetyltransferase
MKRAVRSELAAFWRALGVQPGRPLLCHSFVASLGKPEVSPEHDVLGSLLDALGPEGTLFAPTFTYSYTEGQVYDVQASPSTVGVLGDLVRSAEGGIRSLDPMFSNAGLGPEADRFLARTTERSFGPGTFYEKLVEEDAQILLLGVDFTALPLFMQVERTREVPYRVEKRFPGITRNHGEAFEDAAIHFCRRFELAFENDRRAVGAEIEADPACAVVPFGYGAHRLTTARTVVRHAEAILARDPHALIRFEKEAARVAAAS